MPRKKKSALKTADAEAATTPAPPPGGTELLEGEALHRRVVLDTLLEASRYVWLATANLKDMHIAMARQKYVPVIEFFENMAAKGVSFRVVHADRPSGPFRETLSRFPRLSSGAMELQHCPRSHWKMAVADGTTAYIGSANFTGAGLGCRSSKRRNLEIGLLTTDPAWVKKIAGLFDTFWIGGYCNGCFYRKRCPSPIESG